MPAHPAPLASPSTHILLDVDGTLVDSNDQHAQAWVDVLRESGRTVPFATIRPLIGMGGDKLLPRVTDLDPHGEEAERLAERRTALFLERHLPQVRPLPGTRALCERLHADGFQLVIATSARESELDALLRVAGVADLVDLRTTADDATRSKPDPDIVQAALGRAGHGADETIMIGDTPYDIAAARAAGVDCIALRSGGWSDDALRDAIAIHDHPAALLAAIDETPLGLAGRAADRAHAR